MRWSLVVLLVAISTIAWAEPKVAVAPLDNDKGGRLGDVVADAAGERAKVTKQGRVEGAMRSLGVGVLTPKSLRKLRGKLDVDVVIYGRVEKDGKDKRLSLSLAGKGKSKLSVRYKSAKELRKQLVAKLPAKITAAMRGKGGDDEDEVLRARREEEVRRKKRRDDDDDDDGRRRKRIADRDDEERRDAPEKQDKDEDEDRDEDERPRKKKKRSQRHVLTQSTLWLDAGVAFSRRTLTYDATGMMRPPRVGTAAPAARIEGEVYPAELSSLQGPATNIGVVAAYSRTFALGIAVPGTQIVAPISSGHYALGARYRFAFGNHSLALGLSYWRSHYVADRSQLMSPEQLDMPDVDYSAIAPGIAARIGVTPIVSAFATVDVPLMLYSGPIQEPTSYGSSKILAFDVRAGAQVVLASHVALQVGLDVEQVALTFTGQAGSMAVTRMVTKATDRSIGLGATLGINY